jgi:hypothetical protein
MQYGYAAITPMIMTIVPATMTWLAAGDVFTYRIDRTSLTSVYMNNTISAGPVFSQSGTTTFSFPVWNVNTWPTGSLGTGMSIAVFNMANLVVAYKYSAAYQTTSALTFTLTPTTGFTNMDTTGHNLITYVASPSSITSVTATDSSNYFVTNTYSGSTTYPIAAQTLTMGPHTLTVTMTACPTGSYTWKLDLMNEGTPPTFNTNIATISTPSCTQPFSWTQTAYPFTSTAKTVRWTATPATATNYITF